jgi:ribosomal-protein-alanine N-acetyltransferase
LFAEFYDKCGPLFLVAERASGICGYMITCIGGDRAEIVSIAVDPPARAAGAATVLMAATIRRLRRRGAARVALMVKMTNAPARAFYEKSGFHKVRVVRGYYEDGADALLLARAITSR